MKLKRALYDRCVDYVKQRMETSQQAIEMAQSSANEETKSSAGDKYETGRAMMQLEVERNTQQLAEAIKLKQALDQINPESESRDVQSGSLVQTNQGNFYIAISVGQLVIDQKIFFVVSPTSPVGVRLMQTAIGSSFILNGKEFKIEDVK